MSKQQDPGYYGVRAGEERRLAESTKDSRASAIHADLAVRYQALSLDATLVLPAIRNSSGGNDVGTLSENIC
jgi:hypothetical protein